MGSEILDSSGGARAIAPEPVLDPTAAREIPLVELDELQPPHQFSPHEPVPARAGLSAYLHTLRQDADRRRTTIRTAVICIGLMALTASIVQFRASRQVSAEAAGRVAVDVRLDEVRPASRSFDLNGAPAEGSVTARVELHNLGPQDIQLVGLDITAGSEVATTNNVDDVTTPLAPGAATDTTYNIQLPCRTGLQRGLSSPEVTARIKTVDDRVHNVPVNLSQVNQSGGLLVACISDSQDDPTPVSSYSSTTDGTTVVMTIVVGGAAKPVALVTPNVGVPLRFTTSPKLPAVAQPGIALTIKVTPGVTRCPIAPINFDALQGIGVSIGTEQVQDSYLPALVAQAVGRACGGGRR